MIDNLPLYIGVIFGLTTICAVLLFWKAAHTSRIVILSLVIWLIIQSKISLSLFYTKTNGGPPRFILALGPPLLVIIYLFLTKSGRRFIDSLDLKWLTLLHTIRIPVELVLYWLFVYKAVPQLMTFEGRNFDVISGITALIAYYLVFVKKTFGKRFLLLWNLVCLALLINIVVNAILSFPFPFQQFAFDQPNVGLLYFPFIWLPSCIVPIVLFSHLAAIRRLLRSVALDKL